MYEELIKALHGWNVYGQHLERCNCELAAANAIESLTAQVAALQAENAEKDKHISRVEAERDRAYRHICDQCDIFPCLEDGCPWSCGAQGEG